MRDRRDLPRRAAALSRVIATLVARSRSGISEPALAAATALPTPAVHRILRRLAWKALVRRISRRRWVVAPFVTHRYELRSCPANDL